MAITVSIAACSESVNPPLETQQPSPEPDVNPDINIAVCTIREVSSLSTASLVPVRYEGTVLVGVAEADLERVLDVLDATLLEHDPILNVAKVNLASAWHAPLPAGVRFMETEDLTWQRHVEPLEVLQWQFQVLNLPSEASGEGVIIAISDDGIQGDHPDLIGRMLPGFDGDSGSILNPNTNYAGEDDFHGTHTAGLALARINGEGGRGIAHNARLMPIRVFDETGFIGQFRAARALRWAVDNGANIISASWGGSGYSATMYETITYALERGVVIVASAGNSGQFDSTYPSAYPGVIRVGASTPTNTRASFSSFGDTLSLLAPGVELISSIPIDDYGYLSGTSMAAPLVAGAAAAALEQHPDWTPYQVKYALMASATDLGEPGWDADTGAGLLNPIGVIDEDPPLGASLSLAGFEPLAEVSLTVSGMSAATVTNGVDTNGVDTNGAERLVARTDRDGEVSFIGLTPGRYDFVVVKREDVPDDTEGMEGAENTTVSYQVAEGIVEVVIGSNLCDVTLTSDDIN
jgi:subtilisin family serine protease